MTMFTRLRANCKMRIDDTYSSPVVAFCGDNREGKTARLDAMRLALTGAHPVGAAPNALRELLAPGEDALYARLEGPIGESAFRLAPEDKERPPVTRDGPIKQLIGDGDHVLPLQSMASVVFVGSTLGREMILKRFADVAEVPQPRGLTQEQATLWQQGLAAVQEMGASDPAAILSEVSAWMRREKLARGRELSALTKQLEERTANMGNAAVGGEQLPQWQAQLETALAWERGTAARTRKEEIDAEALAYRAKVAPLIEAEKAQADEDAADAAVVASFQETIDGLIVRRNFIEQELSTSQFNLQGGQWLLKCMEVEGSCVLCGNSAFDAGAAHAQIEPRVQARADKIGAMTTELSKLLVEIKETEAAQREVKAKREVERANRDRLKNELRQEFARIKAAREENERALAALPAEYTGPSSAELRQRIAQAEQARLVEASIDADARRLRTLEVARDIAKELEGEAKRMSTEILLKTAQVAEAAVNRYMPEGFRATLDLDKAKWQVIGNDGFAHGKHAAAGTEFGALIVAAACAWTEDARARFVLLDDEEVARFSPRNVKVFLETLQTAVAEGRLNQVFLTTTRPHELPDFVEKIFVNEYQAPDEAYQAPDEEVVPRTAVAPPPVEEAPVGPMFDPTIVNMTNLL